jgi:hypothetical protein
MKYALPLLCLLVLLGGCKKKRGASTEPDSPSGFPQVVLGGDDAKPPVPLVAARPQLPEGWVEFREPEGLFTVYLPSRAQRIKLGGKGLSLRQPVPQGRMLIGDYGTNKADRELYCEVGVSIYSPELVDGVKAGEEKRQPVIGSRNKKRAPITWCGHPAFEDTAEYSDQPNVAVGRHVWIGNRHYYCVLYGRTPGRPTAEERTAAFDSFTPEK